MPSQTVTTGRFSIGNSKNARRHCGRGLRPGLETLEPRIALSTITVTRTADDEIAGSLRYAIEQVNLGLYDTIDFNFSGGSHTITPTSAFPKIEKPVTINPTLQAVVLDGSAAGVERHRAVTGLGLRWFHH